MSVRLQITYGKQVAEEGNVSVRRALDLLDTLIELGRYLVVKVKWVSEQTGHIVMDCATHPPIPGLQTREAPADWDGLVYTFSASEGGSHSDFGQLFNRLLGLVQRQPDLFLPQAKEVFSRILAPPADGFAPGAWMPSR